MKMFLWSNFKWPSKFIFIVAPVDDSAAFDFIIVYHSLLLTAQSVFIFFSSQKLISNYFIMFWNQ